MRYFNSLQRIMSVISLVLVSYVASAQDDDVVVLKVEADGISIAEEYAESALLIKNEGEVPDYYLYTSGKYIKPIFGENKGDVSKDIYLDKEQKDIAKFFNSDKTILEPESGSKRTIIGSAKTFEDRSIGNADGKDRGLFRIMNTKTKDKFRLTICRAENYQTTLNYADSTLISLRGNATRMQKDGEIVFSINDTIVINHIDVKVPAYTFIKEVRVGEDVIKSYDKVALAEADFCRERNLDLSLDSTSLNRLYDGEVMSVKYVSLNEKGALAKEDVVLCKISVVKQINLFKQVLEYIKNIKWWVYVIIGSVIVLVVASILVVLWLRRRTKRDIAENDKQYKSNNNPDSNKSIADESVEFKRLSNELDEVKSQLQDKEAEVETINRDLVRYKESLKNNEVELTEISKSLDTTKQELEVANNTIAEIREELTRTKKDLDASKSELETIEERHNAEMSAMANAHNAEVERLHESHNSKIELITTEYEGKLEIKDKEYETLEAKRSALELQWKSDREQVILFFQSQLYFIDKYLDVITEKADRNSPIYSLLLQLSDTAYGYNIFRTRVIETLQNQERGVAELVKDVRSFVEESMTADMSWINNASRLYAYASTPELRCIFGNYNDAEDDTRMLIDQIKILVAMWGITDIQIPLLFVTPFNDDEFAYDISNLVLPTLYPNCIDLQKDNMIFDFLRVGFVVNGNKVKPKVAY